MKLLPAMDSVAIAAILELISDGIWDWHADTGYVYRSPGWYRMLGYSTNELENTVFTWENIIHPDDFAGVMQHFDDYISQRSPTYQIEYRCRTKNGDYVWIEDRGQIVATHADGSVARMIGAHRDLSAEKRLQEQNDLEKLTLREIVTAQINELIDVNRKLALKVEEAELLATKDSLTKLYNRLHFDNTLKTECARSARFKDPLSLIALDVDNLKPINDQYGHTGGDATLAAIANVLRDNVRAIDIPVRWGGDEFMLLLPNTTLAQATALAEKLQQLIGALTINSVITTSASFGVAQLRPQEDPSHFVARADRALYQAKEAGRSQVVSLV